MTTYRQAWVSLLVLVCAACSDIELRDDPEGVAGEAGVPALQEERMASLRIVHAAAADGSFSAQIDATSRTEWVGLDLDGRAEADAKRDATWDLSFQRFHVRARGGASGGGDVQVAALAGADWAALNTAPTTGFATDQADGADANSELDTVFETAEGGWYAYDPSTHQVSPKAIVYVVRSDSGRYFKVQLTGYYDAAGTPAVVALHYAELF